MNRFREKWYAVGETYSKIRALESSSGFRSARVQYSGGFNNQLVADMVTDLLQDQDSNLDSESARVYHVFCRF